MSVEATANIPSAGAARHFTGELNEFELFCAYHLGIDEKGAYCQPSIDDVARRFNTEPDFIHRALQDYGMDRDRVAASSFNLDLAKLDIEVAPPGIDRVELARTIFEEFQAAGCGNGPGPHSRTLSIAGAHSMPDLSDPEPDVGPN